MVKPLLQRDFMALAVLRTQRGVAHQVSGMLSQWFDKYFRLPLIIIQGAAGDWQRIKFGWDKTTFLKPMGGTSGQDE